MKNRRSIYLSLGSILLHTGLIGACAAGRAEEVTAVCKPKIIENKVVATPTQRLTAGEKAYPPLTDQANGFAWPDTELGVIKEDCGYVFFGSDGGFHAKQLWDGESFGNDKYGSITRTVGTLDNPLGTEPPIDVTIKPNTNPSVNPFYAKYDYMGEARFTRSRQANPERASCSWSIMPRYLRLPPKASTQSWLWRPHPTTARVGWTSAKSFASTRVTAPIWTVTISATPIW